jgi:hypothetical protein
VPILFERNSGPRIIMFGDGFVSEFSSDLTKLNYSTYLGGSNDDAITGILRPPSLARNNAAHSFCRGGT